MKIIKLIKEHKGASLFTAGLLFNLFTSAYFGWETPNGFNLQPDSFAEFICDYIAIGMMFFGLYVAGLKAFKKDSHYNYSVKVENVITYEPMDFLKQLTDLAKKIESR